MKQLIYHIYSEQWIKNARNLGLDDYEYALVLLDAEKNPIQEQIDRRANADRIKKSRYDNGIYFPTEDNENCARYFGIHIAERYVCTLFEDPIRMPNNNPKFDWICKKGYKIQHKARCLAHRGNRIYWSFDVMYNNIADYFICSAWKDRKSLEPMYMWMFYKNDLIKGYKFWRRDNIYINNKPKYLDGFRKYELFDKLEKLKELCDKINKGEKII